MSFSKDFNEYKEELELIDIQNPVECELYSLIAQMIRESVAGKDIILRDFTTRRTTELSQYWLGEAGFTDFVLAEKKKVKKPEIYGAVEIKYLREDLDLERHLEQMKGHMKTFRHMIYTNGFIWRYYKSFPLPELKWEITLGKMEMNRFVWFDTDNFEDLLQHLQNIDWKDKIE